MTTFNSQTIQGLSVPPPPGLPLAPVAYEQRYIDQLNNILRLYFNQISTTLSTMVRSSGGELVVFPYGAFSDYTDQTAAVINTPYVMTFNTTDLSNGVTVVTGSKLTVSYTGIYNLQWSGQFENTGVADHDADVWIKINGTAVVGSTGRISVPSSHGGVNGHGIFGWNFLLSLTAGDYVELWWQTDSTTVSIQNYAASGSVPSTASLIATMTFVSSIPV